MASAALSLASRRPTVDETCHLPVACLSATWGRFQRTKRTIASDCICCLYGGLQTSLHRYINNKRHPTGSVLSFELLTRLELVTSSLPRKCSTTELQQHYCSKAVAKIEQIFDFANFLIKNRIKIRYNARQQVPKHCYL